MPGDGRRVGGWVELEVLGVIGLLLLGVVLGHGGRGSGKFEHKSLMVTFFCVRSP